MIGDFSIIMQFMVLNVGSSFEKKTRLNCQTSCINSKLKESSYLDRFFFTIPNVRMQVCKQWEYERWERIRTWEGRWVLRERFVVAVSSSPSSYKWDARVPRLWSRGMLSGCIAQRFSLLFVHGRLAGRHPPEKHDLIYYEPHSRRRRVMSCAFALSAF